jgi:Rps23 Pro-64 3,4-dihydroxylase Tpa1-like proline 4-hydroxylase
MLNKKLDEILEQRNSITFDEPFTHYIIEDLFEDSVLSQICDTGGILQEANDVGLVGQFDSDLEKKLAIEHVRDIKNGKEALEVLNYLNSEEFVSFLQELTGIQNLEVDPGFSGGGIHIIPTGGKLAIHIDFSRSIHDKSKFRRLNVLLYLNKNWKEEWNGALELWDAKPSEGGKCIKKIFPHFNRMVIFGTSKSSWHGHPIPTESPEGVYRTSLATYYYSSEPGEDLEDHSTIF